MFDYDTFFKTAMEKTQCATDIKKPYVSVHPEAQYWMIFIANKIILPI